MSWLLTRRGDFQNNYLWLQGPSSLNYKTKIQFQTKTITKFIISILDHKILKKKTIKTEIIIFKLSRIWNAIAIIRIIFRNRKTRFYVFRFFVSLINFSLIFVRIGETISESLWRISFENFSKWKVTAFFAACVQLTQWKMWKKCSGIFFSLS
jgi:hypothetical protein